MPSASELLDELALQARECVVELRLDDALTNSIERLTDSDGLDRWPWLLCYQALERRLAQGDHRAALQLAQAAIERFKQSGQVDGHARAVAEAAIDRYHLGQYATALAEIAACPPPTQPSCSAALALAAYVNHVGVNALPAAIQAAEQGLRALDHETNAARRAIWQIVLQRNLAAAYHYQGQLEAARNAAKEAVRLAEIYHTNSYLYDWALYEQGLLEQRAGRLDLALDILRQARARLEQTTPLPLIWRWVVAAEGHTLRDTGRLDQADACYQLSGWGEGDDGPLMLWLLQRRHAEARMATEARLAAAHASSALFEVTNLTVLLALLDFEAGATPTIRATLRAAVEQYSAIGFLYHRASALCHLAAAEYALGNAPGGDHALADALQFGATHGYLNFAWWHAERMRSLLERAISAGIAPAYRQQLLHQRALAATLPGPGRLGIRCLGDFVALVDDEAITPARWQGHAAGTIRMQRLLLYLARHREPHSIDVIARYVWPNTWDSIDVPNNLHLTVTGLRRVIEPKLGQGSASRCILTTAHGYQLLPRLVVTVDLDQFLAQVHAGQKAAAAGDQAAARAAFAQAEQLYSGDFALAKADPGEADEYRRAALAALHWLAADDLRRGAIKDCMARARRVLRDDPWDTAAPALLIEAQLACGDRRAARRQYERFLKQHGAASPEIARLARVHGL
jgi:DNA-binding SARP family transcriptional activator